MGATSAVTKTIDEQPTETEPPALNQPPPQDESATKPAAAAGTKEEESSDQFDDAEDDDLPVAIPAPEPPSKPELKSNDKAEVSAPPTDAMATRDAKVDAPVASNQEARRSTVKRPPKAAAPKAATPNHLKRPPPRSDDYGHDPHCDADALETLALACLQERKERPRIDKGERVEQDQVTRTDVLCGRGGMTNHHPGNVFYRRVVRLKQESYVVAAKRKKVEIATDIVHIIRCLNPPGRFLRKEDGEQSLWIEIGDKAAIAKTSQALREGAPDIRNLVVGNQSTGEASAPSPGKGMEAPAISDRAKQILANVRKKHKDHNSDFESPARKGEAQHQVQSKGANGHAQQEKQSRTSRSPQTSPQQREAEGTDGGWEHGVPQGHENWGQSFASAQAQAMALQDSTLRGMQRMHQNGGPQRLPPPYIAPPHMQLPPGHVAVLPPGCPIPPGFMLLAPAPQAQLIPVHQMPGGLSGRMMAADPLARSLYSQYFVPHGHTPPELIGSAHLLNRLESLKRSHQMNEFGNGHHAKSQSEEEEQQQQQEEEEEGAEERDEHGQQMNGSDDNDEEEAAKPPSKRSRLV